MLLFVFGGVFKSYSGGMFEGFKRSPKAPSYGSGSKPRYPSEHPKSLKIDYLRRDPQKGTLGFDPQPWSKNLTTNQLIPHLLEIL